MRSRTASGRPDISAMLRRCQPRTVGIGGQGDAQSGEHSHCGDADAVQAQVEGLAAAGGVEADDDRRGTMRMEAMVDFNPREMPPMMMVAEPVSERPPAPEWAYRYQRCNTR